jgi:D-methionine transport system substrate-binding protein
MLNKDNQILRGCFKYGLIMKKIILSLCSLAATSVLASETITIGASSVPHAEMLRFIQPTLAKQGYVLKISEFSEYLTPNLAVVQGQLDANFFQTKPYLLQYNKDHHANLVDLVDVHLEPMGAYTNSSEAKFAKSKKPTDLIKGSKIAVPNDATNEGRALNILQANGIIKVQPGIDLPTKKNITANPYGVEIVELDPSMLPRVFSSKQVDIVLMTTNLAMFSGLNPTKATLLEQKSSPFVNLVAVRADEINLPKMKALAKALTSPEMKTFIQQKYHGAVVPAF